MWSIDLSLHINELHGLKQLEAKDIIQLTSQKFK